MMKKVIHITLFAMVLTLSGYAQKINVTKALRYYQAQNIDSARMYIDTATANAETATDAMTWYYRGFIYKEIYNKDEKSNANSPARMVAIDAFFKYLEMDTTKKMADGTIKSIKYLVTTIYNDAATALNSADHILATSSFELYKKLSNRIEPEKSLADIENQFNLVLAQVYTQLYEQDRNLNKDFLDKTRDIYLNIISKDSNNLSANYNMAILYYNEAVNIIKNLDYDLDLITLELIQDDCINLFRKSLPYMTKAYQLNPNRKETLIGLSGIYFSLNELEKSEQIQQELEKLENGKD